MECSDGMFISDLLLYYMKKTTKEWFVSYITHLVAYDTELKGARD